MIWLIELASYYELVSANTDERQAVEGILEMVRNSDIYEHKGFIGQDWQ